ncbi:MAG TPA: cupin domain-containing protein [Chloroflexota bacterium]|nr:cupin domain-containing protein [Chloroflexota bacterium]
MPTEQGSGTPDQSPSGAERAATSGHVLAGPVLRFDLRRELDELRTQESYASAKPAGKTLVKEPDLRIVLMALKAGGRLEEHRASGPISIQGIEGRLRLRLPATSIDVGAGELLMLEPGVPHDVEAVEDGVFLLTIGRTRYEHVSDHHESRG